MGSIWEETRLSSDYEAYAYIPQAKIPERVTRNGVWGGDKMADKSAETGKSSLTELFTVQTLQVSLHNAMQTTEDEVTEPLGVAVKRKASF